MAAWDPALLCLCLRLCSGLMQVTRVAAAVWYGRWSNMDICNPNSRRANFWAWPLVH